MIKPKSLIGIDIGTSRIKIIKSNSGKVVKVAVGDVPDGTFDGNYIKSKPLLEDAIERTMEKAKFKGGKCALCLNNVDVITRVIELPEMGDKELRENVLFEISDSLPVDLSRCTIDYRVLQENTKDNVTNLSVYVSAIPTELLNDYISVLKTCKLKVEYIDLLDNSIEKVIMLSHKGKIEEFKNKSIALIDYGAYHTSVLIYRQGVFAVNKVINMGIDQILHELSYTLGENINTIRKLTFEGFIFQSDEYDNILRSNFLQKMNELTYEIAQVLEFYSRRNMDMPLTNIYLIGGNSLIPGILEYLSRYFENIDVSSFFELLIPWSLGNISNNISYPVDIWAGAYGATLRRED